MRLGGPSEAAPGSTGTARSQEGVESNARDTTTTEDTRPSPQGSVRSPQGEDVSIRVESTAERWGATVTTGTRLGDPGRGRAAQTNGPGVAPTPEQTLAGGDSRRGHSEEGYATAAGERATDGAEANARHDGSTPRRREGRTVRVSSFNKSEVQSAVSPSPTKACKRALSASSCARTHSLHCVGTPLDVLSSS